MLAQPLVERPSFQPFYQIYFVSFSPFFSFSMVFLLHSSIFPNSYVVCSFVTLAFTMMLQLIIITFSCFDLPYFPQLIVPSPHGFSGASLVCTLRPVT